MTSLLKLRWISLPSHLELISFSAKMIINQQCFMSVFKQNTEESTESDASMHTLESEFSKYFDFRYCYNNSYRFLFGLSHHHLHSMLVIAYFVMIITYAITINHSTSVHDHVCYLKAQTSSVKSGQHSGLLIHLHLDFSQTPATQLTYMH